MRIGIDISQLAYPNTGVANYLQNLLQNLIAIDDKNEYILFFSSLRKKCPISNVKPWSLEGYQMSNVQYKIFKLPPTILDLLWNRLHILPIEWLIGPIDVFISSDWTQPPSKAKKVTILYDLIVYKYPEETAKKIIDVQKRKLEWVRKEVDKIICISEASKKDAEELLHIPSSRLSIVYPSI